MSYRSASDAASLVAATLHGRLGLDMSRPVDVFEVVKDLGIWLKTGSLGQGKYGFYLREGDAAGIFLNANHPETTQRFTCAHELGHHMLGHQSHLDDAESFGSAAQAEEAAAQTFASNFLMPYVATKRAMKSVGILDPAHQPIGAVEIYRASQRLDVSYRALVWQLRANGWLTREAATGLTRGGVLRSAKASLAPTDVVVPSSPQADVRAVPLRESGAILCRQGDDLIVQLEETPATGFRWEVGLAQGGIELLGDGYYPVPGADGVFGPGRVVHAFHLRCNEPGDSLATLVYRQPWLNSAGVEERTLTVSASPRHVAPQVGQLQIDMHALRLAA